MSTEERPFILGVTACTAGVAHTYMAAEALRKSAEAAGADIKVETQGTVGIENRITESEVARAKAIIYAHDVAIKDSDRFAGLPKVDVSAAQAIKTPDDLVAEALAKGREEVAEATAVEEEPEEEDEPADDALVYEVSADGTATGVAPEVEE